MYSRRKLSGYLTDRPILANRGPSPRSRALASHDKLTRNSLAASVVRVLVEMLAPYKGRVYDPCCGSGGMFVQSEKFIEAHTGKLGDTRSTAWSPITPPGGSPR